MSKRPQTAGGTLQAKASIILFLFVNKTFLSKRLFRREMEINKNGF